MTEAEELKSHMIGDKPKNPEIESLQKEKDWFIGIKDNGNSTYYYDKEQIVSKLRTDILAGKYKKTNSVEVYYKDNDDSWHQVDSTLEKFAKKNFKIRVLYQPIWSYAMFGLKWGVIIGVILKLLDTFLTLLAVETGLAILFALAIGAVFIPKIGGWLVIPIALAMAKFSSMNLFFVGLSSALVGAILGCLPGMAIGGFIGFTRKNSMQLANDAIPESTGTFLTAVLIPIISGISLIIFHILVFNPWLIKVLE